MIFDEPVGEAHIKYGFIRGDDYFVVKIATGFYEDVKLGYSSSSGVMLVFSQKTGGLECVLLDEGHLTNVRTAAAVAELTGVAVQDIQIAKAVLENLPASTA